MLDAEYSPNNPVNYIFDLDDTLKETTVDYEEAKNNWAELVQEDSGTDMSCEELIDFLEDLHSERIRRNSSHCKTGFPTSLGEAYREIMDQENSDWSYMDKEHGTALCYRFGWNVVDKSAEDYAEDGFIVTDEEGEISGADEVLEYLDERPDADLHLLTAGPEEVQGPKVEGLGLNEYIEPEDTHIVQRSKLGKMEDIADENGKTNTVMVGNSMRSDMAPAQEAGIPHIYFNFLDWENGKFKYDVDRSRPEYMEIDQIEDIVDIHELLTA